MSALTDSPAWRALVVHHQQLAGTHMRELFEGDPGRFRTFSLRCGDLLVDYSKHMMTGETLRLLTALAASGRCGAVA